MKATQFIKDHGLEKARGVVEGCPEHSQFVIPCLDGEMYFSQREDGKWFKWSNGYNKWLEYFGKCDPMDLAYSILDVERLAESVDQIDSFDYGLAEAKDLLCQMKRSTEKYTINFEIPAFEQAIADYESIYGEGNE